MVLSLFHLSLTFFHAFFKGEVLIQQQYAKKHRPLRLFQEADFTEKPNHLLSL